jgi:hypothetical protein
LIVLRLIRTNRLKRAPHAPYAKKEQFAAKNLQDLRAAFHMAQEMGARVGRGALLL